jgi:hypothetical protein
MQSSSKSTGSLLQTTSTCDVDKFINHTTGVVTEYSGQYLDPVEYRLTAGGRLKDFHKRQKRGELLPHTPFLQYEVTTESMGGSFHTWTYDGSGLIFERIQTPWIQPNLIDDWFIKPEPFADLMRDYDTTQVVQSAAARIYNSGHDTLTFLAELSKVRRLFVSLLQKILRKDLPKNLKEFSSAWLEARYGWRTLLFDLIELHDALQSLSEGSRNRVSERVGQSNSWTESNVELSGTDAQITKTISDEVEVSIRGSITADFQERSFIFNPILTAWEVVPFSFVIDWLINVGQSLAALSFLTVSSKHAASGGVQLQIRRTTEVDLTYLDPDIVSDGQLELVSVMKGSVRTPTSVSTIPQLRLNLDSFKVVDLLALIIQKFGTVL